MKKNIGLFSVIKGLAVILFLASPGQHLEAQNIIGQPRDVSIFEGFTGSVFYAVDVNPDATVTYQWYFKEPGGATGAEMTGENDPVLEVPFVDPADPAKWDGAGFYCVVTGDQEEESLHAYLWVQPVPKVPVITAHPEDVTEETGFTGEINYNVELIPGLEAGIAWYRRTPGTTADWEMVGEGPQLTEKVENLDPRYNGFAYRCLVKHADGLEYSQVAYLWVKEPKKLILTEPVDVYKPEGFEGVIVFDITPAPEDIAFQWQIRLPGKTWEDYAGAEKPVFEFPVKEPLGPELDGMAVRCIARFKDITEVSEPAYLHMEEVNKFILVDPEDVMKKQGFTGELYFAIKYDDSYELAFQWQEKKPGGSWVDITEFPAHGPELVYVIKEPLTTDWNGWGFRCVAIDRNTGDVEYSGEANLYVSLYETYFLGHPRNVTICEGAEGAVAFRVKILEEVKLTLQWQMSPADDKNWYDIPGADSTVYIKEFSAVPLSYNGNAYRCKAVDQYGGTEFSNIAFLYVTALPKITSHPESQEKMVGEAVTFNVMASGAKPFGYQWHKDGIILSGAVSASLSLFPLAESDAGDYTVVVTNACTATGDTSNAATLTVTAPLFEDGWFAQSAVGNDFTDVKFAGANAGWFTQTGSPNVYKTVDGGENWTGENLGVSKDWQAVFTTDEDNVWLAGGNLIKYTFNGSDASPTWYDGNTSHPSLLTAFTLYDLFFFNPDSGWAVGSNGNVLFTSDSGANWTPQISGDIGTPLTTQDLNAVHFVDADTGFAAGNSGVILVTRDGGGNWTKSTSGTLEDLKDVYFITDQVGWISGTGGILLNTSDGGRNWSTASVPALVESQDLNGVLFYDVNNGWLITGNGKILRTNDAGSTWYFQESGTSQALNAIDFADYDNGWIVGNSETILRTAYSGCLLPRVSLFEDKEFCASVNYELVADSFASNIDCSYEWSTGETTGSIIADTSAKYYVTVTSVCGEAISDTVNILLYPLPEPYAGSDQEICDGDSVQLLATGGVGYSWNNAGLLDDANIQNPKAGPPVGITDFIVTVTDENLCQNTDTVRVTVYDIPTSTFTAPSAICDGDSAAIIYSGTASADANFYWDFDERSTILSGDSIGPYGVSWDTTGIFSIELVVEENGCSSDTGKAELTVHPIPDSDFELQSSVCGSDMVEVEYTGTVSVDADFTWDFDGASVSSGDETGPGPIQLSWTTAGTKQVTLDISDQGCASEQTVKEIVVAYPYDGQTICLVTVDIDSAKIAIIWEKGAHPGVEFYRIYRESATGGGIYDLIATLPADTLSYWIDETSEPQSKSHKYRISVIDTCGNESNASLYHKSMLLTTSLGTNVINVEWTEYEVENTGFGFQYYILYRGSSPTDLDSLTTIPNDNTLYVDTDPPAGDNYYQVAGVITDACSPTGNLKAGTGPFNHSLSNLDDNKLQGTGIRDNMPARNNLSVYPNPYRESVRIDYTLQQNASVKIEVFNVLGLRILEVHNGFQNPGVYTYDIMAGELDQSSISYLRFTVDGETTVKKLVPAR
jgi:photosystem II stability/assembly factor-like uncharacterized protein